MGFIIKSENDKLLVRIHVIAGARIKRESDRVEVLSDKLVIRVESPPRRGAANKELIKFLSSVLGVPKRNIDIIRGEKNSEKVILITGINEERFLKIMNNYGK